MNTDLPPDNRAELEARVTALLLGELSAEEAAALRQVMAQDAALAKLHERLRRTLDLLRETAATSAGELSEQGAPLKLSPRRREALLAYFKTVSPKELARPRGRKVSLAVELAALAAIVVVAVGVALPKLAYVGGQGRHALTGRGTPMAKFSPPVEPGVTGVNFGTLGQVDSARLLAMQDAQKKARLVQGKPAGGSAAPALSGANLGEWNLRTDQSDRANRTDRTDDVVKANRPASPPKSSIYMGKAVQSEDSLERPERGYEGSSRTRR